MPFGAPISGAYVGGVSGALRIAGTGGSVGSANGSQNVPSAQRAQNMQSTNRTFTVVLAADNTPQPVAGYLVPDGCSVRIRANNGTIAANAAVVFIANYSGAFTSGHGTPLAPLDDVAWPERNLASIWVYGKKGDGIVISVINVGYGNS